jgi:hypothetical protein
MTGSRLYRHVANKAALLDSVHEAVLGGMRLPRQTGDWIEDTRRLARSFRRALCDHPNALPLFAIRPAVTAGSLRYVERALSILSEPFPEIRQQIQALQTLVTFVVGNTMSHFPVESDVPAYQEFPALSGLPAAMARYSVEREFEFGIDALLTGLEAKSQKS